jgi:D-alanyl-D-alanine carboxypeptidase (penicillin-binding protein 5/6)
MMTAILALEKCDLTDTLTASKKASETQFGSLNLKPGEQLTLHDMMYALLLRSANDAAVCIAEHVAGSESEFVKLMNEKAAEIGANDTHFVNPHGLYDPKHYSTAYDLALIARYAVKFPIFNRIVSTESVCIERSMNKQDVYLKNTARFLRRFDGADGIKTGYTREAGHCFVGSATRNGWRLIAVVLKSNDAGADAAALLNYGFGNYKQVRFAGTDNAVTIVPVRGGVRREVGLVAEKDFSLVLPKSMRAESKVNMKVGRVSAPIVKGEKVGALTGYLNGKKIGTVNLVAAESVDRTFAATVWVLVRSILAVTAILLLGYISYGTAVAEANRRRRRGLTTRSRVPNRLRPSGR